MNKQEIENYNRLCAEFMGFKYKNQNKFWAIYPLDNSSYLRKLGYVRMDNLKFHSDWNWIMSILEKISPLNEDDFSDETQQAFEDLLDLSLFSSKESVCENINNFIKTLK